MESRYVKPQREVPEPLREWMDKDPLVVATMTMYLNGDVTLEKALLALATGQTERAAMLFDMAVRRAQVDPPVLRIEIPREQWEVLKAARTTPAPTSAAAATIESAPPAPGTSAAVESAATEGE